MNREAYSAALEAEEAARRAWSAELDRIEATPLVMGDLGAMKRALSDPGYQAKWRAYTEAAQRRHDLERDDLRDAIEGRGEYARRVPRSFVSHLIGHA